MSDNGSGFISRWSRRKAQARQGVPAEPGDQLATPAPASAPTAHLAIYPTTTGLPPAAVMPLAGSASVAGASARASARAASPQAATTPGNAPSAPATPTVGPDAPMAAEEATAAATPPPPPTLDDVALLDRDSADYSRFVARDVQPEVRNAALKKLFTDPHFNVMDGLDIYIDDYSQPDPLPPGMLERMAQGQFLGLFTQAPEAADDGALAAPQPMGGLPPTADAAADGSQHAGAATRLDALPEGGQEAPPEVARDAAPIGPTASRTEDPPADPDHPPSPTTDPAR